MVSRPFRRESFENQVLFIKTGQRAQIRAGTGQRANFPGYSTGVGMTA